MKFYFLILISYLLKMISFKKCFLIVCVCVHICVSVCESAYDHVCACLCVSGRMCMIVCEGACM